MNIHPDKASFVTAVIDWVEKPDEKKSVMRGAIRRYSLMPPISVAREDTL